MYWRVSVARLAAISSDGRRLTDAAKFRDQAFVVRR